MLKRSVHIAAFFLLLLSLCAEQLSLGSYGSFIDPPEGWNLIGQETDKLTFASADEAAYLQLKLFPGASSLSELVSAAESRLGAEGDGTVYAYGPGEAYFGTLAFSAGNYSFSGYLFAFRAAGSVPLVISGFSGDDQLAVYNDQILSALDSFSPLPATDRLPGPVGVFDRVFSSGSPSPVAVPPAGQASFVQLDGGQVESAVYVTEREARILSAAGGVAAWRRFFRILYRDSLDGLTPLIEELHGRYSPRPDPHQKRRIAGELLSWLQGFEYRRSGTLSDFLDPVQVLVSSSGDCDSLGLLYVMLLHSFEIDAILLVSEVYSHALGAADLPGEGARFNVEGKGYVVAELTEEVALGLIAADMADPSGWIPVVFPETIRARPPQYR
jgi:hypothetical protein